MAVSGYFFLYNNKDKAWEGRIDYVLTDDEANNRTQVDVTLYAYKTDGYPSGSNGACFQPYIIIDGISYGGSYYTTEYASANPRASKTVYVAHDSDGKKTLTISGNITKVAGNPATSLDGTYISGSKTITLTDYVTGYTLTYNANGGSGTTTSQYVTAGASVTLRNNGFTAPSARLYTTTLDGNGGNNGTPTYKANKFYKWKKNSVTGTAYSAGDSFTPTANTTFYAQWYTPTILGTTTRSSTTADGYKVTFNANGGTCSTTSLTAQNTTTYTFKEWNSKQDGSGNTWSSTATYIMTNDYTIYAIWSPTTTNGSLTLPTPTRNGYEFLGWSPSESDTNGVTGEYTPTSDIELYAIWKRMGNVYIYDGVDGFNPYQVFIYDGSGWNQYVPYIYTGSGWEVYSG